ncbi:hypothetical protein K502DRAFT_352146 [Neoconidiobolus thromboides FSU 785]|nr:hypothetical protein K502DRAFT_352146 [Neoconidiobolus thromboides FSU 785]
MKFNRIHFNIQPCLQTISQKSALYNNYLKDIEIIPNFINEKEEEKLILFSNKKMKRKQYELNHIDNKILNYREVQVSSIEDEEILNIIDKVHGMFKDKIWLPLHILDLNNNGKILPHIDNHELSGSIIIGLSLLSDTKIKFQHQDGDHEFELLANRRSLYIQKDSIRYNYLHSIMNDNNEFLFNNQVYSSGRRISWLFRDAKL